MKYCIAILKKPTTLTLTVNAHHRKYTTNATFYKMQFQFPYKCEQTPTCDAVYCRDNNDTLNYWLKLSPLMLHRLSHNQRHILDHLVLQFNKSQHRAKGKNPFQLHKNDN